MARTCQDRSKLRNVSHLALSFRTLWPWTIVTSSASRRQGRTRTPNRQSKANRPARILLVCPRETGACHSGCSSAGGRGRADHVEWCFFASQEERAMKLTLFRQAKQLMPPHSLPIRTTNVPSIFTRCLHHRHQ